KPAPVITLVPDTPGPVSDAIARALAKNPADRFPTIDEFGAAITAAEGKRAGEGVKRRYVDLETRAAAMRKELPRWRHPLTGGGIVAALLLAATFGRTLSRPAYELAGQREQASFVATSVPPSLGGAPTALHPTGNVS